MSKRKSNVMLGSSSMEGGGGGGGGGGLPYSVSVRRERSRELAQKRRTTYKSIMDDLNQVLPFPKDVLSQLDYNSRLRLTLCFFRMKTLMEMDKEGGAKEESELTTGRGGVTSSNSTDMVPFKLFQPGMLQNLMTEALDGFLMVASSDGTIIYLSESVHHHLGIFQSEHIGISMFEMMNEEDHEEVKSTIAKAQNSVMSFTSNTRKRSHDISFFCRMKCSRFKVANAVTKSPGFKLVYISGCLKLMRNEYFLVMVVRPVSPPSILELRMEANMFITHYNMEMNCLFFDGRLRHLLGYTKNDLEGKTPFVLQHHEDTDATLKCSEGILRCGEGLSGYYRFLCQSGSYVWLQTRATLMHDSRTGKPTYIMCMNYIIDIQKGDKDLRIRHAITAKMDGLQEGSLHSYDPFPLNEREDGAIVNPLQETSWQHKDNIKVEDLMIKQKAADDDGCCGGGGGGGGGGDGGDSDGGAYLLNSSVIEKVVSSPASATLSSISSVPDSGVHSTSHDSDSASTLHHDSDSHSISHDSDSYSVSHDPHHRSHSLHTPRGADVGIHPQGSDSGFSSATSHPSIESSCLPDSTSDLHGISDGRSSLNSDLRSCPSLSNLGHSPSLSSSHDSSPQSVSVSGSEPSIHSMQSQHQQQQVVMVMKKGPPIPMTTNEGAQLPESSQVKQFTQCDREERQSSYQSGMPQANSSSGMPQAHFSSGLPRANSGSGLAPQTDFGSGRPQVSYDSVLAQANSGSGMLQADSITTQLPQQPLIQSSQNQPQYPDYQPRPHQQPHPHYQQQSAPPRGQLHQLLSQQYPEKEPQVILNQNSGGVVSNGSHGKQMGGAFHEHTLGMKPNENHMMMSGNPMAMNNNHMAMSGNHMTASADHMMPNWNTKSQEVCPQSGDQRVWSHTTSSSLPVLTGEDLKVLEYVCNYSERDSLQEPVGQIAGVFTADSAVMYSSSQNSQEQSCVQNPQHPQHEGSSCGQSPQQEGSSCGQYPQQEGWGFN